MISERDAEKLSHHGPRRVSEALPGPRGREVIDRLLQHEMGTGLMHGSLVTYAGGKGSILEDADGNRFVDLWTGRTATPVGISHPAVIKAVHEQVDRMTFAGDGQSEPRARLLDKIADILPAGLKGNAKIVISQSGSQANEVALRLALRATGRSKIVAFANSYHGVWGLTWEVTGGTEYHSWRWGNRAQPVAFMPYPSCYRCPMGLAPGDCGSACANLLEHMMTAPNTGVDDIACVIVEMVQDDGYSSVTGPWLQRLRSICDRIGAVLIIDEVLTGMGNTGTLWAHEPYGVKADIVTMGKGVGGTFPLAITAVDNRVAERAAGVSATNGGTGNAVAAVAGLATLELVTDPELELPARARAIGEEVRERVLKAQAGSSIIGDVRIHGTMGILELVRDRDTRAPVASGLVRGTPLNRLIYSDDPGSLLRQGYLFRAAGPYKNCVKWMPSLTVPRRILFKAIDDMLDALRRHERELATG